MFLVPADTFEAEYVPSKASLVLSATGQVGYDILDVHFKRDIHLVGGLGFHLRGFEDGRSSTEALKPYAHKQVYCLPNFFAIAKTSEIIVTTANHPHGTNVPVKTPITEVQPGNIGNMSLTDVVKSYATAKSVSYEPILIDVPVGGDFTIKASTSIDPTGSLDIDFNPYLFLLKKANIDQGSLFWTFKALREGQSPIAVDSVAYRLQEESGLPITQTLYVVNVQSLRSNTFRSNASAIAPASNGTSTASSTHNDGTFKGQLQIALRTVRRLQPESKIVQVELSPGPFSFPPVTDPVALSYVTALFQVDSGVASIKTNFFGEWQKPILLPGELPPISTVKFDLKALKDIIWAVEIMRNKGIAARINRVSLARNSHGDGPQIPELDQPFYKFFLEDDTVFSVGGYTGYIDGTFPAEEEEPDSAEGGPNGLAKV